MRQAETGIFESRRAATNIAPPASICYRCPAQLLQVLCYSWRFAPPRRGGRGARQPTLSVTQGKSHAHSHPNPVAVSGGWMNTDFAPVPDWFSDENAGAGIA